MMAVGSPNVPKGQGKATLTKEKGQREKGTEREWKFTVMKLELLGSGTAALGVRLSGMGLRPNGQLQDLAGELGGGFSRTDAGDNREEGTKSWGLCVRTRNDLVAASHRPVG